MHKYANPTRFLRLSQKLLPWLLIATVGLLGYGLYLSLFVAPPDYQQGEGVRIMYVHVPAAWMSVMIYVTMGIASATFLVWRHGLADVIARASAPIGAAFTFICLVTGAIWGKPMWGTWWVWDARLTSVLVLFFLYIGYMVLAQAFDDQERASKSAAVLNLIGLVNIPIIKFSVDWWNTLHQPASIVRLDGPTIHPEMLWPLLLMIAGFACFYFTTLIFRVRGELASTKRRRMQLAQLSMQ